MEIKAKFEKQNKAKILKPNINLSRIKNERYGIGLFITLFCWNTSDFMVLTMESFQLESKLNV